MPKANIENALDVFVAAPPQWTEIVARLEMNDDHGADLWRLPELLQPLMDQGRLPLLLGTSSVEVVQALTCAVLDMNVERAFAHSYLGALATVPSVRLQQMEEGTALAVALAGEHNNAWVGALMVHCPQWVNSRIETALNIFEDNLPSDQQFRKLMGSLPHFKSHTDIPQHADPSRLMTIGVCVVQERVLHAYKDLLNEHHRQRYINICAQHNLEPLPQLTCDIEHKNIAAALPSISHLPRKTKL